MAVVTGVFSAAFVQCVKAFFRAEAVIRLALADKLFRIFAVNFLPLALHIRPVIAADIRPLVVFQTDLLQRVVDHVHGALNIAFPVGVLDAENKVPSIRFCNQIFKKSRPQVADVHKARRAWGESCPNFVRHESPS